MNVQTQYTEELFKLSDLHSAKAAHIDLYEINTNTAYTNVNVLWSRVDMRQAYIVFPVI